MLCGEIESWDGGSCVARGVVSLARLLRLRSVLCAADRMSVVVCGAHNL